ncbi:MAG: BspA family leucine-rich repeat surface protein [Epibacterium sp.]|nr:BspA family leucine-rich repeat surface protein [Epibacterium sp.]NQX73623.1 DUF285 domain-containing protein [Epibacterium sp.]
MSFTPSKVSDGTLVTWTGAGNDGFVVCLYDQSGNDNHATQSTASAQPKIVDNGVLVVENGRAAFAFDEVLHTKLVFTPNLDFSSGMFLLGVYANRSSGAGYLFFESIELGRRSNGNYRFHSADFSANGGTHSTEQVLLIGQEDGATAKIFANGVEYGQGASSLVSQTIERIGQKTLQANVNLAIAYNFDQSANRESIESDLNDIYATFPSETNSFRILVDTEETGVSNNDQFQLTGALGNYMVDVYDATGTTFIERHTGLTDEQTITIAAGAGQYELWVLPVGANGFNRIRFNAGGDRFKLLQIRNWGNVVWSSMNGAFRGCRNLGSDPANDNPNLSNVTTLFRMFRDTLLFNQDISDWDVSNVIDAAEIFNTASAFNQDISGWDTSSITRMTAMFLSASSFDQDIGGWDVSSVTGMTNLLAGATLSTANYDALLIGWAAQNVQNNVSFHGGNSQYTPGGAAEAARDTLINTYGWTITDGGPA